MKIRLVAFVLAYLLVQVAALEWFEEGERIVLTDQNYTTIIKTPRIYKVVKFFTPWCGFCRVLKPHIQKARDEIAIQRKDVVFYEVNCRDSPNTCFNLQVAAFPCTIITDQNGNQKERFMGVWPYQNIVDFVNRNADPPFKEEKKQPEQKKEEVKEQQKEQQAQQKPVENKNVSNNPGIDTPAAAQPVENFNNPKPGPDHLQEQNDPEKGKSEIHRQKTVDQHNGSGGREQAKVDHESHRQVDKTQTKPQAKQEEKREEIREHNNRLEQQEEVKKQVKSENVAESKPMHKIQQREESKKENEVLHSQGKQEASNRGRVEQSSSIRQHDQNNHSQPSKTSKSQSGWRIVFYILVGGIAGYILNSLINKQNRNPSHTI